MLFRLSLLAGAILSLASVAAAATPSDVERPEYVVRLREGPGAQLAAQQLASTHGARHTFRAVFPGFSARLAPAAVDALSRNPRVASVEPAFIVTAVAQSLPLGIDRIDAERAHLAGSRGTSARVAVVDTGIDLDHPDLIDRIEVSLSRTFVASSTVNGDDDQGHGTHVAGTIAASDNSVGVIGVAPAAKLIALKVLNSSGSGYSTDIIAALDYITAHNNAAADYASMIHVANFSLGGSGSDSDSSYRRAFNATVASGCVVVAAAGNSATDAATFVPAAYDAVITVSAMSASNDSFASFSNYGADVDIAAPGVSVYSTTLGGGYGSKSGTSMAAPHVAGGAALFIGANLGSLGRSNAVELTRAALLGAAEPIVMAGDPDGIREPLLDAEALVAEVEPPAPALALSVAADKTQYGAADVVATLTAQVRDEMQAGVSGLDASAFQVSGATFEMVEAGDGAYLLNVDISSLGAGESLSLDVTVAAGELSDTASVTLTKATASAVYVAHIGYRDSRRDMKVDVSLDQTTDVVPVGASVSIALYLNGSLYGTATSTTSSSGIASFNVRRAPSGDYVTRVESVRFGDVPWDASLDYIDPGFRR
ncbi:MAG: S8 family serine peptidase [Myxococcota bacterium]